MHRAKRVGRTAARIMGALPCPSRLASSPTTSSCWTSTAASGWATSPPPARSRPSSALRAAGSPAGLRDQRRAPRRGRLRAQAVGPGLPGRARGDRHRGRRAAARAGRVRARDGLRDRLRRRAPPRDRRRPADPQPLRHGRSRRRRRGQRPRALRLRRAARRGAGRAARGRGVVHEPRRDLPDARRPVAGDGLGRRGRRGRHRRATARSVGKPEPQLFLTALDRLGDGRALVDRRSPRRRRGRARAPPGSTARSCSPAPPARRWPARPTPPPTFVAASLAELLLAP